MRWLVASPQNFSGEVGNVDFPNFRTLFARISAKLYLALVSGWGKADPHSLQATVHTTLEPDSPRSGS